MPVIRGLCVVASLLAWSAPTLGAQGDRSVPPRIDVFVQYRSWPRPARADTVVLSLPTMPRVPEDRRWIALPAVTATKNGAPYVPGSVQWATENGEKLDIRQSGHPAVRIKQEGVAILRLTVDSVVVRVAVQMDGLSMPADSAHAAVVLTYPGKARGFGHLDPASMGARQKRPPAKP